MFDLAAIISVGIAILGLIFAYHLFKVDKKYKDTLLERIKNRGHWVIEYSDGKARVVEYVIGKDPDAFSLAMAEIAPKVRYETEDAGYKNKK